MKRINIILEEDEKSGGYTIYSHDIVNGSLVITEGDDLINALENFKNTVSDVTEYNKKDKDA